MCLKSYKIPYPSSIQVQKGSIPFKWFEMRENLLQCMKMRESAWKWIIMRENPFWIVWPEFMRSLSVTRMLTHGNDRSSPEVIAFRVHCQLR